MTALLREFHYPLVLLREGLVAVAVVWAVLAAVRSRRVGARAAVSTSLAEATLAAGVLVIWALTLAPLRAFGTADHGFATPVNLVPVLPLLAGLTSPEARSYVPDYLGNVALFVPFGVGLAWRLRLGTMRVGLIALACSAAIETWQAVSAEQRNGDINDVLLNTTGALLGAIVVNLVAGLVATDEVRTG
jgi:VanZ family protein